MNKYCVSTCISAKCLIRMSFYRQTLNKHIIVQLENEHMERILFANVETKACKRFSGLPFKPCPLNKSVEFSLLPGAIRALAKI